MKPAAFVSALFLLAGTAAHSQWSLLPHVGIETPHSNLYVNGQKAVASLGGTSFFKAALRTDYRFKGGHGPYASMGSSPAALRLSFTDPETLSTTYATQTGGQQWRLEGGYGVSSRPIYFKKGAATSATRKTTSSQTNTVLVKKRCGSETYMYRCQRSAALQKLTKNRALNMRLQPAVGMAYLPNTKATVVPEGRSTRYRVGNWNTALVSSIGVELARGPQRFLTLQLAYTKGIGQLHTRTVATVVDGKTTLTTLRATASAWALTAGIPIQLTKRTAAPVPRAPKQDVEKTKPYKRCGRTVI